MTSWSIILSDDKEVRNSQQRVVALQILLAAICHILVSHFFFPLSLSLTLFLSLYLSVISIPLTVDISPFLSLPLSLFISISLSYSLSLSLSLSLFPYTFLFLSFQVFSMGSWERCNRALGSFHHIPHIALAGDVTLHILYSPLTDHGPFFWKYWQYGQSFPPHLFSTFWLPLTPAFLYFSSFEDVF